MNLLDVAYGDAPQGGTMVHHTQYRAYFSGCVSVISDTEAPVGS